MYQQLEFQSEGVTLRGRYYPQPSPETPTVVMAHGTSATITMVADAYAETFAAAGLNVLLYDHPNFGASDGEPRFEINPWVQARGYRDAVSFLRRRGCGPIALWGDSYTATQVLVVGALIDGISAIVSQIPACGIELPSIAPTEEAFAAVRDIFESGDVSGGPEHTTGPLPVVSPDQINSPSLLKPIQAFRWFMEYGGRYNTGWENRATRVIPPTSVPFSPWLTAHKLTAPTLFMVGREDEMVHCDRAVQTAIYEAISGPKEWYEIDGGHFGLLWYPGKLFDEASAVQATFLRRRLLIQR